MKNLFIIAASTMLFGMLTLSAMPLSAQEKPVPPPKPKLEQPDTAPDTPAVTKPAAKPAPKVVEGGNVKVVEEIVARVNNEIITQSELEKARASAEDDAKQECQGKCTPDQLAADVEDRRKNALRDLIDQSLLVQRGKDMAVSVEPEVIKKLDQIRIQNNLASMEDLEKAVSGQGVNWEDFKNNIRNGILTQRVIGSEVGSHINIGKDEIAKYYEEHKQDFVRPEQIGLREIKVSTGGKKEEELPELKKKAETALKRVQDGEDFAEIAKRFSDGSTAKQGGFLGVYKRGELSKELEDVVFKMKKNELTAVMDTKEGYLVLQVMEHYDEGLQPLTKVEPEITDRLYTKKMEPALREYLKTLREQSYVVVKPGFQDIAGGGNSEIQEVNAVAEANKAKKARKKYLLFGKKPASNG
ncbi:MAG TPA: peptidylprolyl isomerase [Candidatus Acidoferrum sp.]|jgi:peptidyl-prolyl cis-trans isomerase SurA